MWATIAAMAVQITKTQMATAITTEISPIVSSFTFKILLSARMVAAFRALQPDGRDHSRRNSRTLYRQLGVCRSRLPVPSGSCRPAIRSHRFRTF